MKVTEEGKLSYCTYPTVHLAGQDELKFLVGFRAQYCTKFVAIFLVCDPWLNI